MADPASGVRVTADEVREIFETNLPEGDLNAAINLAHQLVVALDLSGAGVTEATLVQIELLLGAHFACLKDPRPMREKVGQDFDVTYQGKTAMGLNSTFYGQNAITLDFSGILADHASGLKRAGLKVVFSAYDEFNVPVTTTT